MNTNTASLRRTKIVCTLGPAVASHAMVESLIKAGMNVARINRSHGTFKEHADYIKMVRDTSEKLNRSVAILIDIPGPKYRTGAIKDGSAVLKKGAEVVLTSKGVEGDSAVIPLNFPNLYKDVNPGNKVLINDGEMQLKIKSIRGKDVVCKVIVGGVLTQGRGVVVPGMKVSEPFITDKLIENLEFAVEQKAEWLSLIHI